MNSETFFEKFVKESAFYGKLKELGARPIFSEKGHELYFILPTVESANEARKITYKHTKYWSSNFLHYFPDYIKSAYADKLLTAEDSEYSKIPNVLCTNAVCLQIGQANRESTAIKYGEHLDQIESKEIEAWFSIPAVITKQPAAAQPLLESFPATGGDLTNVPVVTTEDLRWQRLATDNTKKMQRPKGGK